MENLGLVEKKPITFRVVPEEPLVQRFYNVGLTPEVIEQFTLRTGEALVDPDSNEVAHIDLIMGDIDGPVGKSIRRGPRETNTRA